MSDPLIDVEQLLAPVSEENPSGEELSPSDSSGPFMRVKDVFDEARKLVKEQQEKELSGGVDSFGQPWRNIPAPDWTSIIDLASATIKDVSKDFRIASWLSEALLRKYNVRGLRDGLKLCQGLCERYWETIHPPANEDDGHGATVSAFAGLVSDSTTSAIFGTVLVEGKTPNDRLVRRYTVQQYLRIKEAASGKSGTDTEHPDYVDETDFRAIAAVTAPEFHVQNLAVINECISSLNALGDFFRGNCKDDEYGEPTSPEGIADMRARLETVKRLIVEFSGNETSEQSSGEVEEVGQLQVQTGQPVVRQEMTRETAFRAIEDIARYFERTEPQSPVHYALRNVVRWGRLPLPELLAELIEDRSSMDSIRKLIGLPNENQDR